MLRRPKSPELLQAQAAAFALEGVKTYADRGTVFDKISTASLDISDSEQSSDLNTQYKDFLRSVGGSKYDAIQVRTEMFEQYNQVFKPIVQQLLSEIGGTENLRDSAIKHPAFMGAGSNAVALSITHGDKPYAVRIPTRSFTKAGGVEAYLAGAILGRGIPHLEQIVAASYDTGVTVAEIIPGKEMGYKMTLEDVVSITDEQLKELLNTLITANLRGIEIDPKPTNILYDQKAGFGIIDYGSSKTVGKDTANQSLGEVVGWMTGTLTNAGSYGGAYKSEKTRDEYAYDFKMRLAILDVLERFKVIVSDSLESEDRETAIQIIDEKSSWLVELKGYSETTWVDERMAEEDERKKYWAEHADNQQSIDSGWGTVDT